MAYRTDLTGSKSLPGSTSIGLLTQALIAQIQGVYAAGYGRATFFGGTATFYNFAGLPSPTVLTIPVATLDSALLGEKVWVDGGGGAWGIGTITADPSTLVIGGAVSTPLTKTARAIDISTLTGYTAPQPVPGQPLDPTQETSALVGVSVDGHPWFSNARLGNFYGGSSSLSTVGAIAAGSSALCETVAATTATAFSSITQTGSGAGTVTPTATAGVMPTKHSVSIRIDISGAAGSVASWSYALDGSGYVSAGTVASLQLAPSIAVTLAGTFTATDVYAFTVNPPTGGTWRLIQL
jgi:hypothetical protein